jgi:uncharacterized protein with NRDE domain
VCTLAVALQTDRRWPLVVAANRDERLGRPAESWALREGPGGGRFAAPRDLQAGGTWIGVSANGLFAAVTNYHAPLEWYPDASRRSRGELVELALRHPTAGAALEELSTLDATRWNPFHLVAADAERAFLWRYDGEHAGLATLGPGLHVVTESSPDGSGPRGDLIRARWPLDPGAARLRELLTFHAKGPLMATCIHMDPLYGTRSSAVLRLAPSLAHSELYVADGPPCQTPFEDRSHLLSALSRLA